VLVVPPKATSAEVPAAPPAAAVLSTGAIAGIAVGGTVAVVGAVSAVVVATGTGSALASGVASMFGFALAGQAAQVAPEPPFVPKMFRDLRIVTVPNGVV
jgi:hypothetical protein